MDKPKETMVIHKTADSRTQTLLDGGKPVEPAAIDWKIGHANDLKVGGSKITPEPAARKENRPGKYDET
ncbi:MAG TPA: hypothetical protein VNH65_03225 [Candidatus Acidoferrum sp.]|nr:hypothetical protein [Candidatus Acidoferrum sp.]